MMRCLLRPLLFVPLWLCAAGWQYLPSPAAARSEPRQLLAHPIESFTANPDDLLNLPGRQVGCFFQDDFDGGNYITYSPLVTPPPPPPVDPSDPADAIFGVEPNHSEPTRPVTWECMRRDVIEFGPETLADHYNYYSSRNLAMLALGFGMGAALAHTDVDHDFDEWYQAEIRGGEYSVAWVGRVTESDHSAGWCRILGDGSTVAIATAAGWVAGHLLSEWPAGKPIEEWSNRTARSLFVGTPPVLVMQRVIGGRRPLESAGGSEWTPFHDENGVSGHSYMGALPFINAAKMTDQMDLKVGLYACSTLAAWSRINDQGHYVSQALLGWWMAWCAATVVDTSFQEEQNVFFTPIAVVDGAGIGMTYCY